MTAFKNKFMLLLLSLFCFTACQQDSLLDELAEIQDSSSMPTKSADDESLIVLSAPSIYNNYYAERFEEIIDYLAHFADQVEGKDHVLILADEETMPYLRNRVPAYMLQEAYIEDIWIRDFAPVMPERQIKFNYRPDGQARRTSNRIDNSFEGWFHDMGLSYGKQSKLHLDGGNVVDNAAGTRVVVTDRFLWDNPQFTVNQAKRQLKQLLGVQEVAIIPEQEGDATGHADGMLMWATDNKILLHELPAAIHQRTLRELERAFPGVEIVVLPNYYVAEEWKEFSSACNLFINSLVTDRYIYMPTFNSAHDQEMLRLIQSHTDKQVVPIDASGVCMMGGSVRCLSWQLKGNNADLLLQD